VPFHLFKLLCSQPSRLEKDAVCNTYLTQIMELSQ
jgi:hypothetical protein